MNDRETAEDLSGPAGTHDELAVVQLGRAPYRPVLEFQKDRHRKRRNGEVRDTLIYVEHEPVYTLGKAADPDHIVAADEFLEEENIETVEINRGGDVTYHGPGQVVGYPIVDLREHRRSVSWYMRTLEGTIMNALETWGTDTRRREGEPGVWVGNRKICAVGVRIARWVTYHGFALNLDPDMRHFDGIIPCGIEDGGVVSMAELLSSTPDRETVREQITASFRENFGFEREEVEEVRL